MRRAARPGAVGGPCGAAWASDGAAVQRGAQLAWTTCTASLATMVSSSASASSLGLWSRFNARPSAPVDQRGEVQYTQGSLLPHGALQLSTQTAQRGRAPQLHGRLARDLGRSPRSGCGSAAAVQSPGVRALVKKARRSGAAGGGGRRRHADGGRGANLPASARRASRILRPRPVFRLGRGGVWLPAGSGAGHSHRSETRSARSPSRVASFSMPFLKGASRLRRR
jgi:hypothetical protein